MSNTTTTEIKRSASLNSNGYSYGAAPATAAGAGGGAAYPSPPPSATSPTVKQSLSPQPQSPRSPAHRQEAFSEHNTTTRRRRGSSLSERFPGDTSHRPLDTLTKEKHVADRARHATRKHHIQPDTIDNLDNTGGTAWHHGGPYDATLFARNNTSNSPLAALADSNAEALKATPTEKIIDSVRGHRPLDGVAAFPPGGVDRNGNVYNYQEGENMMIEGGPEGGAYKRWPGVKYDPDDIKGKGEPSYSIEKALKEHRISDEKANANGEGGMEMTSPKTGRHRSSSGAAATMRTGTGALEGWDDGEAQIGRSGSISKRLSGGLKKRFGSIKRSHHRDE